MTTFVHNFESTDLASRHSAAVLRESLEQKLSGGGVVLDFSRVESVSESYADELLGVLVIRHGLPGLFENLRLTGARASVAQSLAGAIRQRLTARTQGDNALALLAARDALARQKAARAAL